LSPARPTAVSVKVPPYETAELRKNLTAFLNTPFEESESGIERRVGDYTWGVYAFFDYDGEPIYVGQTNERLRTRIQRHLTNQRTDAVAMSVLDPFEVYEIELWPLPAYQKELSATEREAAKAHLNALESLVYKSAIEKSAFGAILNEKDPPAPAVQIQLGKSFRATIVSDEVYRLRSHPDFRIARRALTISRLAQVISERKVQGGLRRVLLTQAKRLQWLSDRRYAALGGASSVEQKSEDGCDDE
jgi:hypothetical protein